MIKFDKFILENGLKVIVHQDDSSAVAVMDILYSVGARDEHPDKTGFAHLFEHLMFEGSLNIPHYDSALQMAGGTNNAFTTNDITNYYLTLPSSNLETAFWLESDRMLGLAFSEKALDVQRHVVIEEFRQRYLNQPYGDVWLLLRPLAYQVHPYQWPTIGKKTEHIEDATLDDVKEFFDTFYSPDNAIMVVSGNVNSDRVRELSGKWFGGITSSGSARRQLPKEPKQTAPRLLEVERDVPLDALYMTFHMSNRNSREYYQADLVSDILSRGKSSRLNNQLIKKKNLFSELDAYVTGNLDEGLFVISGKLMKGVKMKEAEEAVWDELEKIKTTLVEEKELRKVKNQVEAYTVFGETSVLNKAMNLASFELLGDAAMINEEVGKYLIVTTEDIRNQAQKLLVKNNCSTLYYFAKK